MIGTYTATLGPAGPELTGGNPTGRWTLQVTEADEAFLTPPAGEEFPIGNPIEVAPDRIVFAPDLACPTQPGAPTTGTYEWVRRGDSLRLTEVDDSCRDRAFVLTSQRWQRGE